MFQKVRSFFSKPSPMLNITDQRFGLGASTRVANAIDDEVSQLSSYRGRMDIYLFDVMPFDGRDGALTITSFATGTTHKMLVAPEHVHDKLLAAAFRRSAHELGYTGRILIGFGDFTQADGTPFRLDGAIVRNWEDGSVTLYGSAA